VNDFFCLPLYCDIHHMTIVASHGLRKAHRWQHLAYDASRAQHWHYPGIVIVDADGAAIADEDAMPIAVVDYSRPMPFVSRSLASWSSHCTPRDVYRASPYPMVPTTTAVNSLAVHRIMEHMGYSAGHGLGQHHQGTPTSSRCDCATGTRVSALTAPTLLLVFINLSLVLVATY
jgi:hypothetical protein